MMISRHDHVVRVTHIIHSIIVSFATAMFKLARSPTATASKQLDSLVILASHQCPEAFSMQTVIDFTVQI